MLIFWQQICVFQVLIFGQELPQFFGWQTRKFPKLFSSFLKNSLESFQFMNLFCFEDIQIFILDGVFFLQIAPFIMALEADSSIPFRAKSSRFSRRVFKISYLLVPFEGSFQGFNVGSITWHLLNINHCFCFFSLVTRIINDGVFRNLKCKCRNFT